MTPFIPVALSAVLLVGSPLDSLKGGEDGGGSMSVPQAFAIAASVLGAATACDQIARDQLSATARQVSALAKDQASDLAELAVINRLLVTSAAAGRQALDEGKTDCKSVRDSFDELERLVLQTDIALRRPLPRPHSVNPS